MSTTQTCHLEPTTKAYVKLQWQIIEQLFLRINELTSEELHALGEAKNKLEVIMATGDMPDHEKIALPDLLSVLYEKQKFHFQFTKDELRFIYGVSHSEEYKGIPRAQDRSRPIIEERLKHTTLEDEYAFMFDCLPSQVVQHQRDLKSDSLVLLSDYTFESEPSFIPALRYIAGEISLSNDNSMYGIELADALISIDRLDYLAQHLERFRGLLGSHAQTLLDAHNIEVIEYNLSSFVSLTSAIADQLASQFIQNNNISSISVHRNLLQITDEGFHKIGLDLQHAHKYQTLLSNLDFFQFTETEIELLIEDLFTQNGATLIFNYRAKFPEKLISMPRLLTVLGASISGRQLLLDSINDLGTHTLNALRVLLPHNLEKEIVEKIDQFPTDFTPVEYQQIAEKLLAKLDHVTLRGNLKKLRYLRADFADRLFAAGLQFGFTVFAVYAFDTLSPAVVEYQLRRLSTKELANWGDAHIQKTSHLPMSFAKYLLSVNQGGLLAKHIPSFDDLTYIEANKLIQQGYLSHVVEHLSRFAFSDPKVLREFCDKIIATNFELFARNLNQFPPDLLNEPAIIHRLLTETQLKPTYERDADGNEIPEYIPDGTYADCVAAHLEKFDPALVSHEALAEQLLAENKIYNLAKDMKKFQHLSPQLEQRIHRIIKSKKMKSVIF